MYVCMYVYICMYVYMYTISPGCLICTDGGCFLLLSAQPRPMPITTRPMICRTSEGPSASSTRTRKRWDGWNRIIGRWVYSYPCIYICIYIYVYIYKDVYVYIYYPVIPCPQIWTLCERARNLTTFVKTSHFEIV